MKNFEELTILRNEPKVCLISHEHPDADAISSMIVFRDFLINHMNVQEVDIFSDCTSLQDSYLSILENVELNKLPDIYPIAIMMDSTADDRLGQYASLFNSAKTKIVIDHHMTNKYQGDINIVNITSSTCQIVYEICNHFRYKLSKENQGKLYAGLITDTNNLSVGEINRDTFLMLSEICVNIDSYSIYEHFFSNNTIKNMRLLSKSIDNITSLYDDQIILSHITQEESNNLHVEQDDYNGIINRLSTITGCKFVLFVYPRADGYYVSMRARHGYDVSVIAKKFGGGGHKGASAFLSTESIERIYETITQEFMAQLPDSKQQKSSFKF